MCTKNFTHTKKFYVHEIAAVDLSKIYFLKNAKKTCKPNNHDLNRDWKIKKAILDLPSFYFKFFQLHFILSSFRWLPLFNFTILQFALKDNCLCDFNFLAICFKWFTLLRLQFYRYISLVCLYFTWKAANWTAGETTNISSSINLNAKCHLGLQVRLLFLLPAFVLFFSLSFSLAGSKHEQIGENEKQHI